MESSHQTTLSIADFFFWKLSSLGQSTDVVLVKYKFHDNGFLVYKRKQIDVFRVGGQPIPYALLHTYLQGITMFSILKLKYSVN